MPDIPLLRKPDGTFVEAQADAEGNLTVVAETTGPGGAGLAEEATLQEAKDAAESIAATVAAGGVPTPGQPALAVVNVDPAPTFAAAPPTGTDTGAVYLAGAGPLVTDRDGNLRYAFVDPASSVIEGNTGLAASQLEEINLKTPELEGGRVPVETELGASGALATEEKQDLGNASLASLDAKAPALVGGRIPTDGSGVTQPVSAVALPLPAGASTEATLATRSSEATTQAIEDAVDGLESNTDQVEAKLDVLEANKATATNQSAGNATLDAILEALGDALGPYARTTFGQLRVAARETQFDNVQEYGLDARAWGTQTATGGTVAFNTTTGLTDLAVTSSSGSTAKLRTNTHFIYQPGAVTRVILTVVHSSAGHAGQVRRWGFFNDSDGVFFELSGTSLRIVRRTSTSGAPVDTDMVDSASWDNPASQTLTFGNRYEIDLQWLSFGTVRFWINGALVHTFEFSNSIALPYTRTAQLPISMEIVNTGASTAASMSYVCSTVYLDGGTALRFVPRERALAAPKTGIGTTYAPLIGLRMRDLVFGRTNRKIVIPTTSRVANASGRATVAVFLNPASTTGGTWTAADAASGVEYNEGITSFTGGTELTRIFLPNTADSRELDGESSFALNGLHLRRDAFNTTGDLVLFAGKADVGTADIDIVARWKELG